MRELFEQNDGRTAYVYDTIAQIDPPNAAFALGLWIDDARLRTERFKALIAATAGAFRDWHVKVFPFSRPLNDTVTLLTRAHVDEHGRPALAARHLWVRTLDATDEDRGDAFRDVDAAWLSKAILDRDGQARTDRMDVFGFGQRVFASVSDTAMGDVEETLRAFPRSRLLMLTLERIGVTSPSTYAAAARRAHRLSQLDAERGFAALAQFQAALALVARMARVKTIDAHKSAALAESLIRCDLDEDGRYGGAVVRWLEAAVRPDLVPAGDLENTLLASLAGKRVDADVVVTWEGQQYKLDPASAEMRRLRRSREKQGGYSIELASRIEAIVRKVSEHPALDGIHEAVAALKALEPELNGRMKTAEPGSLPPAVGAPKNARETVDRAIRDLARIDKSKDAAKAAAVAPSLFEVVDIVAAEALLSLAYALDIGDPDGAVMLGGNVALRHDFGFAIRDDDARAHVAWGMPKPDVVPSTPWRVRGSLLALDVGLSSLALRRINADRAIAAPALTSNERDTFTVSLALMNRSVARGHWRRPSPRPRACDSTHRRNLRRRGRRGEDGRLAPPRRSVDDRASTARRAAGAVGLFDGGAVAVGRSSARDT